MFSLSTKGDYGLAMMVYLAGSGPNKAVSIVDMARDLGLPKQYLSHVILPLRRKGLVKSFEGKSGGYALAKNASSITILEIIEALEGKITVVRCLSLPDAKEKLACAALCQTRGLWEGVNEKIREYLGGMTLAGFVGKGQ
ncbi:MAG: putative Rrf2 family transcriptional regulator [Parcubacteria group bacterium Gr01-1014_18]|nr:MAG: putative Rrf2 family transcriptional regulator [Parcubacteria group bacterium Greene0416_36]TSC80118.1 MAG: putative Rrf2 family transcriptional regulator [Parcubacteria group bacterium Gr01-1014_18]TSC98592.1 MAG: putative Rrf2 family transcriptional regulator [Parcubacteria group bacterium Greene1014_20]TSD06419.1 MAG: putative Rrf2 family transcriptional regulator [Parcubacteria group bacterium Greene0714_2]